MTFEFEFLYHNYAVTPGEDWSSRPKNKAAIAVSISMLTFIQMELAKDDCDISIKNNKRLFWANELNKVLSSNDINFFSNK